MRQAYIYIYIHTHTDTIAPTCIYAYTVRAKGLGKYIYAPGLYIYIHTHTDTIAPTCIYAIAIRIYTPKDTVAPTFMHKHLQFLNASTFLQIHSNRHMHFCTEICAPSDRRTHCVTNSQHSNTSLRH